MCSSWKIGSFMTRDPRLLGYCFGSAGFYKLELELILVNNFFEDLDVIIQGVNRRHANYRGKLPRVEKSRRRGADMPFQAGHG